MLRLALGVLIATTCATFADAPRVVDVSVSGSGDTYRFSVTVSHPDTGWDHYADGWEVSTLDGTRLGFRELLHPHVNEQPFTRSLGGVSIPSGTTEVIVRAHDSVHGWGEPIRVTLP